MNLSIVIATRNRAEYLRSTLESIARIQSRLEWEVIFVDNASSDDTANVLKEFRLLSEIPATIVKEPRPGAGRARNCGWRLARGTIIGFIDDDCYPAPDYVDRVHDAFADPGVGFTGGRVLLHDPADLRITIQEQADIEIIRPRSFIPAGFLQGANWAARRSALEEVGGFDPNLGPGTPFVCEEVELQARLSAAGWLGVYDPRPLVYHHHRRKSLDELGALQRTYDLGRGAYYAKCLLNPKLRLRYAAQWISTMRHGSMTRVRRELQAAGHYLWLRAWGRLEVSP